MEITFQLVKYIQDMDKRFYGFIKEDLCTLTFEFATRNNLPNTFSNGRAGGQWYYNFMQRHPELSLRRTEFTSIARACGFNRARSKFKYFLIILKPFEKNTTLNWIIHTMLMKRASRLLPRDHQKLLLFRERNKLEL